MLQSFPILYENEIWYSVLCRLYISQEPISPDVFQKVNVVFCGLQDDLDSILNIALKLPISTFSIRELILKHTLFPYVFRFHSYEQKKRYLNELITGQGSLKKWNLSPKTEPIMRYCPVCRQEEESQFGESYWHREHQLPLVKVCLKHQCKLIEYPLNPKRCTFSKFGKFPDFIKEGVVLPSFLSVAEPNFNVSEKEILLSDAMKRYLELPLEIGSTTEYNNIFLAMEKTGYSENAIVLHAKLQDFFGKEIVMTYLNRTFPKYFIGSVKNWLVKEPMVYILLATFLNLTPDQVFGERLYPDQIKVWLQNEIETGGAITKERIMEQFHLSKSQVEPIFRKKGLPEIWKLSGRQLRNLEL